ncbi:diablo homolog, mitochondrial-like [Sinocyclocheilus anshuiensis]|nr:PREDICTED: diablo homolog, mitochondrial-like [Sinocyclocheilus anshuiensis]
MQELRTATDFALRATKVMARSLGQFPVSQASLFVDTVEDFAQQFSAVQKQTEAIKHILLRRDSSNPKPPGARSSSACPRGRPSVVSTPAPPQETQKETRGTISPLNTLELQDALLPRTPLTFLRDREDLLPLHGYVGNRSVDSACTEAGGMASAAQPVSLAYPDGPARLRDSVRQAPSQKPENLTHEDLVRRASSLVTDSANTYLSQTTLALLDSFSGYIKAINSIVTIHKRYVASMSKLTSAEEDAIWQVILRQRQEVIDRRNDCKRFESCWMTAINLSKLAAEAAFNAGADQASVTAQNSLQFTQSQVEHVRQQMLEAERQLKDSKAEDSERLQNALSTAMEDEDVPDAYLRED